MGSHKGKQPPAMFKAPEVLQLIAHGKTRLEVADQLGVVSVYRVLALQKLAA
jgi:hypothetical protein